MVIQWLYYYVTNDSGYAKPAQEGDVAPTKSEYFKGIVITQAYNFGDSVQWFEDMVGSR